MMEQGAIDSETARVRSRLLVDHFTGTRYAHLMRPHDLLSSTQAQALEQAVEKVAAGYPVPYVVGRCEFYGLEFVCDERALIPRPETEVLVEAAVARLQNRPAPVVADLGTGTGCIAISVAHALPTATVYATDLSPNARDLARQNAAALGVADRVQFLTGQADNWAPPLQDLAIRQKFDAILSNPPYIAAGDIETLQPEVRDWEPRLALIAGQDGLSCYRQIATQCRTLLKDDGFLMVELGAGQFGQVRDIFVNAGWKVEPPLYDLAGIERVLVANP